jgi:hypothetical protein
MTAPIAHRTTWTPDHELSHLDYLEQYGHDYNDIHGYGRVLPVLAAVLVVFWGGLGVAFVLAVTT